MLRTNVAHLGHKNKGVPKVGHPAPGVFDHYYQNVFRFAVQSPVTKLVLLPGMDGTGELFKSFVETLPGGLQAVIVRYPTVECLPYRDLMPLVCSAAPTSEPFVLLAESFSTPLAIRYAATHPVNLKGLILCAGFASSPVQGWRRFLCSLLTPVLFRFAAPKFVLRHFLIGADAPPSLLAEVKAAITRVTIEVLTVRLGEVLDCDVFEELGRVEVPILYLRAKRDRLIADRCSMEIQRIQALTVVEMIDGPHLILQREPTEATLRISKFIQEL